MRVVDLGGAVVALDLVERAAATLAIHLERVNALPLGGLEAATVVGDARDLRGDLDLGRYDPDVGQVRSLLLGGRWLRRGSGLLLRFGRLGLEPGEQALLQLRAAGLGRKGGLSRSSPFLRITAGST
ncbi:hypothetical protein [Streptomyces sp. KR55]|uniref:hypothetical protein n=1 Tax=Streptomyces sp. KR55 TaxID=3457425 RepID=UPI003FCFDC0C